MSEGGQGSGSNDGARQETQRRFRRWSVAFASAIVLDEHPIASEVVDISPGGARIRLSQQAALSVGDVVTLEVPEYDHIPAQVRHRVDDYAGLMFLLDAAEELDLARHLVATESSGGEFA